MQRTRLVVNNIREAKVELAIYEVYLCLLCLFGPSHPWIFLCVWMLRSNQRDMSTSRALLAESTDPS